MLKAVIGIGFGDEGKGRTVDFLTRNNFQTDVVRFSGGHQAAHHVVTDKYDHVFSNIGSGTFNNCPTHWTQFCTVEPRGLMNELNILEKMGVKPELSIHPKCPVVTPIDMIYNQRDVETLNHGSCGVGFGATLQREEDFHSILFEDLYNPTALRIKVDQLKHYYGFDVVAEKKAEFLEICDEIAYHYSVHRGHYFNAQDVIFEGSQGLLLDQHYGFFPNVTRSNTGSTNIKKLAKSYHQDIEYYLVTRAYQTRHGNGPMTNEDIVHGIKKNPYEQNGEQGYQGKFRETLLDVDLLEYGLMKDHTIRTSPNQNLVITCMDLITDDYRFTRRGKIVECSSLTDFVEKISKALRIKSVLLSFDVRGDLIKM